MTFRNWFLPHKDTHKKAHLISWEGLLVYVLFFILLQVGFSILSQAKPGVLGISGNIDQKRLIELTNEERKRAGLPLLSENPALSKAAVLKARNMFEENYWAHFAPSGKSPWDFILGAGYKFTFAGENLAKNFSSSEDIVNAWMASPTHRDNLLSPKYQDIGIAVEEGILDGQRTMLVVQEFGSISALAGRPSVAVQGQNIEISKEDYNSRPELVLPAKQIQAAQKPLFDPYVVYKTAGFSIVVLITLLLTIDIWVLRKRGVFRFSSHHVAHMALLSLAAGSMAVLNPGAIL